MPVNVEMYICYDKFLDLELIKHIKTNFVEHFKLSLDDFYMQSPLLLVSEAEQRDLPFGKIYLTCLNVNFLKRYYGLEYKFGYFPLFYSTAEWFENILPGCKIYYGHDVTEESIKIFDKPTREVLLDDYFSNLSNKCN